ncbi:MAG: YbaB/EbfC family nucleoid-associated protein [Bacteroidota bacterium]
MFDMMKMMGKLKEVQEKMKVAQSELSTINVEAEAGAGMVKAVVNGHKEIVSLLIDDSLYADNDRELMKDLIIAAVNKAMKEVEVASKEHLKKATDGLLPNIPGFDFNNMM